MALIDKLSAIGDAIREKTGKDDLLTLDQMPIEIQAIETGGGDLPEEAFIITGNCNHQFAYGNWDWFVKQYGKKIKTVDIDNSSNMFCSTTLTEIPFDINYDILKNSSLSYTFYQSKIHTVPKMSEAKPSSIDYIFNGCYYLREIPDDFDVDWDWSYIDTLTSSYNGSRTSQFSNCYSLRKYPNSFLRHGNPMASYSVCIYYNLFSYCGSLDEVVDLPFPHYNTSLTSSNGFYNTFKDCYRLKRITFDMQENNSPYIVKWKSQTIDLSSNVGYTTSSYKSRILNYNSGITEATRIFDETSYQLLKDNPDSWTMDVKYSRYNHNSAVETINSLPDSSATGTNIIKFKGESGALTDGGAINTLTEEEIAVATAKGWTVSLA